MGKDVTDYERLRRIVGARTDLLLRQKADPTSVPNAEARKARLTAAAKRERERVAHLVLGEKRPDPELVRPAGMSKQQWKIERKRLREAGSRLSDPEIEAQLQLKERWSHKAHGTPETWDQENTHTDSINQLEKNGTLDKEQVEWIAQIANVHRSIEADVAIGVASLEARVDQSRSSAHLVGESLYRVRMHRAYTAWRKWLPSPKQLVLDMIVGDRVGYTVAAKRHHVHHRTARKRLLAAVDRWPEYVDLAFRLISKDDLDKTEGRRT